VKNAKNLSRKQKEFLIEKGLDPSIHLIVKNLPDFYDFYDFYEFYNKVTRVTFIYWR
jgi:hypothetical protein